MRNWFRRKLELLLGLGLASALPLLLATGCRCSDEQANAAASVSALASASAPPARLAPLSGPAWTDLEEMSPGGGASKGASQVGVWVPVGAEKPRPIVVLLGGLAGAEPSAARLPAQLFDRLEHDVFVIAIAGTPPSSPTALLRDALTKLKARFGAHVAKGSVLLVATGPFAAEATALLREEPSFFARAVLFDFDPALWSGTLSYVLKERGGRGVIFTTSDPARRSGLEHSATITKRAGTPARVLFVPMGPPTDHGVAPQAVAAALAELPWLLGGDERFPKLSVPAAEAPSQGSEGVAPPPNPSAP